MSGPSAKFPCPGCEISGEKASAPPPPQQPAPANAPNQAADAGAKPAGGRRYFRHDWRQAADGKLEPLLRLRSLATMLRDHTRLRELHRQRQVLREQDPTIRRKLEKQVNGVRGRCLLEAILDFSLVDDFAIDILHLIINVISVYGDLFFDAKYKVRFSYCSHLVHALAHVDMTCRVLFFV